MLHFEKKFQVVVGVVFGSAVPTFQQKQVYVVYVVEKQKNKVVQKYPNMVLVDFFVPTNKNCLKKIFGYVGGCFSFRSSNVPTKGGFQCLCG